MIVFHLFFYSPKEKCYLLYQRSNMNKGSRLIMVSKSYDKKNWSDWKHINICDKDIMSNAGSIRDNYYCTNMFYLADSNYYIALLPYAQYNASKNLYTNTNCSIYYSLDGINWKCSQKLTQLKDTIPMKDNSPNYGFFISGEPIMQNNNHIYYYNIIETNSTGSLVIKNTLFKYIFKEYEYSYITSNNDNEDSIIETIYIDTKFHNLIICAEIVGKLNISIKNKNGVLNDYSISDKISDKISVVSWNNQKILPDPPYTILISFKNTKIFYLDLI